MASNVIYDEDAIYLDSDNEDDNIEDTSAMRNQLIVNLFERNAVPPLLKLCREQDDSKLIDIFFGETFDIDMTFLNYEIDDKEMLGRMIEILANNRNPSIKFQDKTYEQISWTLSFITAGYDDIKKNQKISINFNKINELITFLINVKNMTDQSNFDYLRNYLEDRLGEIYSDSIDSTNSMDVMLSILYSKHVVISAKFKRESRIEHAIIKLSNRSDAFRKFILLDAIEEIEIRPIYFYDSPELTDKYLSNNLRYNEMLGSINLSENYEYENTYEENRKLLDAYFQKIAKFQSLDQLRNRLDVGNGLLRNIHHTSDLLKEYY